VSTEHRVRHVESRRLYRWLAGLGLSGIAVCVLVLAAGVRAVQVSPADARGLRLGALQFSYPVVNGAAVLLLGLAVVGAAVLLVVLCLALRQARATRRMIRSLPIVRSLGERGLVLVIDAPAAEAFCAGWLRPRVYVSTAALERLSDAELQAVLAHEHRHGVRRDPLRLAIGRVLCRSLFFLPVLRALHCECAEATELVADAAALDALGGARAPLASAMLTLGGAAGDGEAVAISDRRVDALLGQSVRPRRPWSLLAAAVATQLLVLMLVWRISAGASVHASLTLPLVSPRPCLLLLALAPALAGIAAALIRRPAPAA
jgi:multisubunit Na+/H+ antiporter MnhC subunit